MATVPVVPFWGPATSYLKFVMIFQAPPDKQATYVSNLAFVKR
jgi:hypothetical protein